MKLFLTKIPSIQGLDHISYRINPIDKWFDFYFPPRRGLIPLWTINHGWISGIYYQDPDRTGSIFSNIFPLQMSLNKTFHLTLKMGHWY